VIEISRSSPFLTISTVFFPSANETAREAQAAAADLIGCIQSARHCPGFEVVRTLHIDLLAAEEQLFSRVGKSTRNQINRATKHDGFGYRAAPYPTNADIAAFRAFYNGFARAKGTTACRAYQVRTLKLLAQQNALVITRVDDGAGAALCYHVYVADGTRAMLLYSGSQFRNAVTSADRHRLGRANRFLHWRDILFFKSRGFAVYDCGGLTEDGRVAEFKRSFGGAEVVEYTGYVPLTWRGRAAAQWRGVLTKLRRHIFSPRERPYAGTAS
jgi:hypothetical protein